MDAELASTLASASDAEPLTPPTTVTVAGNELTVYIDAPRLFAAMVEDIARARARVWLESYIILDDTIGRALADALIERARAGVEVRVLYDSIGCLTTPAAFFRRMEEAGVEVHAFHSLWEALWRFPSLRILNRRDHRKLLVVDDRVAYFGGMNVAAPARAATIERAEQMPSSSGWRDVHVRMTGPQQGEVAESFDRSWQRARGARLPRRSRAYRQGLLAAGREGIQFFDSGPGLGHTRAVRLFTRLIRAARQRLTFSMAYFVPVGNILRELVRAHRRGVFIQVVIPGASDVPLVHHATRYLYRTLLRRRFHLYERQLDMLHSKVLVVDDQWTVLGSANLDARSLWINLEFLAVVHSRELARVMNEIIREEIKHSRRVTLRTFNASVRWWQRLLDRLAWSLRWWL